MIDFHFKNINDPIHGNIGLSHLETKIISSPAFQRLHNVKQLGLANLVFPGANYSRFSHSVGACYVVGQLLQSIERNCDKRFDEEEIQRYRLAALLHDIGHYPFSHTIEHVVSDHYKDIGLLEQDSGSSKQPSATIAGEPQSYDHETLGRKIIEHDPNIGKILHEFSLTTDYVKSVFSKETPDPLVALISSDLDCDRLDYLMRTAHYAGLPYGNVDIGYIISQANLDNNGHLCLNNKALRAADHLLISRYFDYTQLPFHKTVVAFELALTEVFKKLLQRGVIDCSSTATVERIKSDQWGEFDDQYLIGVLREERLKLSSDEADAILASQIDSILLRKPPKLVASSDLVLPNESKGDYLTRRQQISEKRAEWSNAFSVDESKWYIWNKSLNIIKVGSKIPLSDIEPSDTDGHEKEQLVKIMNVDPTQDSGESKPLISCKSALVHQLSNSTFFGIRLYVQLDGDEETTKALQTSIRNRIVKDLPNFQFTFS